MENTDSKSTSNFLKGTAILAVLINHYINSHMSGNYQGYSNLLVGIFFYQSGHATYYSLNRRFPAYSNFKNIFLFYCQRCFRIFPLLWIAWVIEWHLRSSDLTAWILSGIHTSGHYWFIPALFQCYFFAPFVFWGFLTNISLTIKIIISFFIFFIFFWWLDLVPSIIISGLDFIHAKWRGIYFLHILFFTFGLLDQFRKSKLKIYVIPKFFYNPQIVFWFGIFVIICTMWLIKLFAPNDLIFQYLFLIAPLPFLTLLCQYAFYYSLESKVFSFFGRVSYSIYLFHISYFIIIDSVGGLFPKNHVDLAIFFISFPFFLVFCFFMEKLGVHIYRKFYFPFSHLLNIS